MREDTRYRPRVRENNIENNEESLGSTFLQKKLALFLKQSLAVVVIIVSGFLINRSGFEFGKNCIEALSRAVRHNFDFGIIWANVSGFATDVWRFFVETF